MVLMVKTATQVLALLIVTLFVLLLKGLYQRRRYPPGPLPLPLIGNFLFFSKLESPDHAKLLQLREEWGAVTMIWLGSQPAVIVNTAEAVTELLNEQSAVFSSRPEMNGFRRELWPWRLVSMPTGNAFKLNRKLFHKSLGPHGSMFFRKYQDHESSVMMQNLLGEPKEFIRAAQRYTMSVVFSVVYGVRLDSLQHPLLVELQDLLDVVMKYFEPGTMTVDFIPVLERIPIKFQPRVKKLVALVSREMDLHLAFLKTLRGAHQNGSAPDCFGKFLIESQSKERVIDDQAASHILAMLIGAGADTTGTVLTNAFKILALHPDCVQSAQEELDQIIGQDRLPTWEDEPNLPYLRALIKEIHRYSPIGSLGIPHCATRDYYHDGKLIPRGAIVFPNLSAISRDPELYQDPYAFDPLRHMDDVDQSAFTAATQSNWRKRDHFHYGFGRRLCPGIHVAEASLFIVISRLIWGFTIRQMPGKALDMNDRYHALVWKPNPFEVEMIPRSETRARLTCDASTSRHTGVMVFDDVMKNVPHPSQDQLFNTGPKL